MFLLAEWSADRKNPESINRKVIKTRMGDGSMGDFEV
jgi:hypothetical protein